MEQKDVNQLIFERLCEIINHSGKMDLLREHEIILTPPDWMNVETRTNVPKDNDEDYPITIKVTWAAGEYLNPYGMQIKIGAIQSIESDYIETLFQVLCKGRMWVARNTRPKKTWESEIDKDVNDLWRVIALDLMPNGSVNFSEVGLDEPIPE